MYRLTRDPVYRRWGLKIFKAINATARNEIGFASVQDVEAQKASFVDETQSFVFAETFKYLYLLFSDPDHLDLDEYVLNTEGHPLRKLGRTPRVWKSGADASGESR